MNIDPTRMIAVVADPSEDRDLFKAAARLSLDLRLPFLEKIPDVPKKKRRINADAPPDPGWELLLVVTQGRLELRTPGQISGDEEFAGGKPIYADFSNIDIVSGAGRSHSQPIAKAVGLGKKKPTDEAGNKREIVVIDATAGWGEDTWTLAGLGCRVLAVERSGVMTMLLRDALIRSIIGHSEVVNRVSVVNADAKHLLRRMSQVEGEHAELPSEMKMFLKPDVVMLDPMFPTGRKTGERKSMKALRRLVGDDPDAGELLAYAVTCGAHRVVVKRPAKGDRIEGWWGEPDVVHEGKSVRFDVYIGGRKL